MKVVERFLINVNVQSLSKDLKDRGINIRSNIFINIVVLNVFSEVVGIRTE